MAKVLIIDDDMRCRALLTELLMAAGHQVCEDFDDLPALTVLRHSPEPVVALVATSQLDEIRAFEEGDERLAWHRFILLTDEGEAECCPTLARLLASRPIPAVRKPDDCHVLAALVAREAEALEPEREQEFALVAV